MANILILYSFEKISNGKKKQFDRKLFGSEEKTHRGKYSTNIKGFLSNKIYEKPIRSTLIIEKKYLDEIKIIFSKFNAKLKIYNIQQIKN